VSIINDSDSDAIKAAKQLCEDDDQTQWNLNVDACENKCNDPNRPWYNTNNQRCEAPNAASLEDALNNADTQATLDIFSSFGTGSFGFGSTTTTTTTTTTSTTSSSSTAGSQCGTGQYFSFIKKICIDSSSAGTAPVPTAPVIPEKTEEEKLKEAGDSINKAFAELQAIIGDSNVVHTEPKVNVNENIKAPTMDISSAFNFFSGGSSNV
jgi:hypothetical protein